MLTYRLISQGPNAYRVQLTKEAYRKILHRLGDLPRDPNTVEVFEDDTQLDAEETANLLKDGKLRGHPIFGDDPEFMQGPAS